MDEKIDLLINHMDWDYILEIYNTQKITWNFQDDTSKIPNKDEISEELRSVVKFMISEDIPYYRFDALLIEYTNDSEDTNDSLVISVLHNSVGVKGLKKANSLENVMENGLTIQEMKLEYDDLIKARKYEEAIELNKAMKSLEE
jgi:hypothetical protein